MITLFCVGSDSGLSPKNCAFDFLYAHNKLDDIAGGDLVGIPIESRECFDKTGRQSVKVQLLDGQILDAVAITRQRHGHSFTLVVLPYDLESANEYFAHDGM